MYKKTWHVYKISFFFCSFFVKNSLNQLKIISYILNSAVSVVKSQKTVVRSALKNHQITNVVIQAGRAPREPMPSSGTLTRLQNYFAFRAPDNHLQTPNGFFSVTGHQWLMCNSSEWLTPNLVTALINMSGFHEISQCVRYTGRNSNPTPPKQGTEE
jgi:hypothetical protein